MIHTIPATTLRNHLSDAIKTVSKGRKFMLVTQKHKPVSALINLDYLEDLLAAASPGYRDSIREAREDYKHGRVFSHQDVFGGL